MKTSKSDLKQIKKAVSEAPRAFVERVNRKDCGVDFIGAYCGHAIAIRVDAYVPRSISDKVDTILSCGVSVGLVKDVDDVAKFLAEVDRKLNAPRSTTV
jgi:hypothetical protein